MRIEQIGALLKTEPAEAQDCLNSDRSQEVTTLGETKLTHLTLKVGDKKRTLVFCNLSDEVIKSYYLAHTRDDKRLAIQKLMSMSCEEVK